MHALRFFAPNTSPITGGDYDGTHMGFGIIAIYDYLEHFGVYRNGYDPHITYGQTS